MGDFLLWLNKSEHIFHKLSPTDGSPNFTTIYLKMLFPHHLGRTQVGWRNNSNKLWLTIVLLQVFWVISSKDGEDVLK